jgi:hypothetical protein
MIAIPSVRGVANRSSMAEQIILTSTKGSGTWGGGNSAYVTFKNAQRLVVEYGGTGWSGGAATVTYGTGTGYGTQSVYISRAVSSSGAKTITIYPADSSGQRTGIITQLSLSVSTGSLNTQISGANFRGCRSLQAITIQTSSNTITGTLDFSGMKELTYCNIASGNSNQPTEVNVSGCSSLAILYLTSMANFTTITGLSDTAATLQNLSLDACGITSLNVNNFVNLSGLSVRNCTSLTSLRAQNCTFENYGYSGYGGYLYTLTGGADLQGTSSMTVAAMEQFFTDLGSVSGNGLIAVYGSGGLGADTSIATAKGYTVVGNVPP